MAMDAIKGLISSVPDWIKRLDDLSSQIDQRQLELARIGPSPTSSPGATPSRTKSVRHKGSTESLKPNDEPATREPENAFEAAAPADPTESSATDAKADAGADSGAGTATAVVKQHITTASAARVGAKPRATIRKREKRSNSVISNEVPVNKYRTRSMIIVYYDSYVQAVFEDLVKYVSATRNTMRKAKMAAKVAQIKRMAELEMPDLDDSTPSLAEASLVSAHITPSNDYIVPDIPAKTDNTKTGDVIIAASDPPILVANTNPALNYTSTLQMRSLDRPMYSRAGSRSSYLYSGRLSMGGTGAPDVYDRLDKGLEYVQSMCEHAAHQFLRDGDCSDEINNVRRRLGEVRETANEEMERVKKEDPEALKQSEEPPKSRSFRPQSMRKEPANSKESVPCLPAAAFDLSAALEVDEGIDGMDQDIPKLEFRRAARSRAD